MAQKKSTAKKSPTKTNSRKIKKQPIYKKVWFWLATGGAALLLIGGGLTVFLLTRNSYEKIYNEYSQTIETKGDQLLKDFEEKADKNNAGSEGLDKIYEKTVKDMKSSVDEGIDAMDDFRGSKSKDAEYDKWSDKLTDLGKDKIDDITDAYTSHEDYQKYSDKEKEAEMERIFDEVNQDLKLDILYKFSLETNSDGVTEVDILLALDAESIRSVPDFDEDVLTKLIKGINDRLLSRFGEVIDKPQLSYFLVDGNDTVQVAEYEDGNLTVDFSQIQGEPVTQ